MKRVISFFSGILMLAMMIMPVFRPQVQVYADDGFNGASFQGKETVYINYAYKVEDKNTVDYGLPSYTDTVILMFISSLYDVIMQYAVTMNVKASGINAIAMFNHI